MNGSLISDLIRRETNRLRALGKGYEQAAREATAYVERIHLKEVDAREQRMAEVRKFRKRKPRRRSYAEAA